jgi:hypothetical protein
VLQVAQIVMSQPQIPVPQLKTRKVVRPLEEVSFCLVSVPDILLFQILKLVGSNCNTSDLCLGSCRGHWVSWLLFLWLSRQMLGQYPKITLQSVPSTVFPIH